MPNYFVLLILVLSLGGYAQPIKFQKTYGTNEREGGLVIRTMDGGYMLLTEKKNVIQDPTNSKGVV